MKNYKMTGSLLLVLFVATSIYYVSISMGSKHLRYITWDSLEPDIWASVWIIKQHIAPDSEVVIRPVGAPAKDGIAFGLDDAKYKRDGNKSVYEALLALAKSGDHALQKLGKIIHDIEITPWANPSLPESPFVENAFRALQENFPNRTVPPACYGKFFDITYQLLTENKPLSYWQPLTKFVTTEGDCVGSNQFATRDNRPFVRRVNFQQILDTIGSGKKVIFVDAREEVEYNQNHIPGAIRMSLLDVKKSVTPKFDGAALVVGYCIKDFRGFEVARALAQVGVKNTATMKPYGIAGWMAARLPTTGVNGLTEARALSALHSCATGETKCL